VNRKRPNYAKTSRSLASRLDELCKLEVVEADDKTAAVAGNIIVAPGGKQNLAGARRLKPIGSNQRRSA
jgi:chemotaxis response regulator CheB